MLDFFFGGTFCVTSWNSRVVECESRFFCWKKLCQIVPVTSKSSNQCHDLYYETQFKTKSTGVQQFTRWWFQIFFMFTPIWGRFPFWLIFFKGVETTNSLRLPVFIPSKSQQSQIKSASSSEWQTKSGFLNYQFVSHTQRNPYPYAPCMEYLPTFTFTMNWWYMR